MDEKKTDHGSVLAFIKTNFGSHQDYDDDHACDLTAQEEAELLDAFKQLLSQRDFDLGEADVDGMVLRDDFLLQCIRVRHFDLDRAATLLRNFIRFRLGEHWPFHIPQQSVLEALTSNVHWVRM
jgi:hypothetical protein